MPTCPVCAYPSLQEPARSPSGGGSYEICPSCGFQFGVDDDDKGITHEQWRARWKEKGYAWSSRGIPAPKGWNAEKQMGGVAAVAAKPTAKPKAKEKATKKPAAARKPMPKPKKKAPPAKPSKPAKKSARKKR